MSKGVVVSLGVLMVFCGIVALGSPFIMGAMMANIIGVMMILGGILEVASAIGGKGKAAIPFVLVGILSIIAGISICGNPLKASAVFSMLMVGYFIAEGIMRSNAAIKLRPMNGWGIVLFSGIISVLLGVFLLRGWPISGMMAIGVFAGFRLLFTGVSLLTLSSVSEDNA